MPLILVALAAFGVGAFGGAQADDAIEVVTGEKDVFPLLPILFVLGVGLYIFVKTRKAGS